MENDKLIQYSSSLISRFFKILDLSQKVQNELDTQNLNKFIEGLIVEIEGSLRYYDSTKFGNQMTSVLMKMNGLKSVTDYNVTRKSVLDSIEIVNRIRQGIPVPTDEES